MGKGDIGDDDQDDDENNRRNRRAVARTAAVDARSEREQSALKKQWNGICVESESESQSIYISTDHPFRHPSIHSQNRRRTPLVRFAFCVVSREGKGREELGVGGFPEGRMYRCVLFKEGEGCWCGMVIVVHLGRECWFVVSMRSLWGEGGGGHWTAFD